MGFSELKTWLRHTHPMVYLDRITEYSLSEYIHGTVAISGNMDCIAGHFPGKAIFPATHLQQSFCQAAVILYQLSTSKLRDDEMAIVGSMNSRFYKMINPGDLVHIEIRAESIQKDSFIFSGKAFVEGECVGTIKSTMMRTAIDLERSLQW